MEIKRISQHGLSIYLNAADLEELGITYEALDYLCPHTRLVIQQLLETALAQTGFDPAGHRLLIEAYPVDEDACLLLFTLSDKEERAESTEPTLFLFSSFELLRQGCRQLKLTPPSALYWQKNQYILALWLEDCQLPQAREQLAPFSGVAADSFLLLAELKEHDRCLLAQSALEKLRRYFP